MTFSTEDLMQGRPGPHRDLEDVGDETGTRETIRTAKEKIVSAYDKTKDKLNETMRYGYSHPGQMSLVAFGAGLGVGLLLARARNRRPGIGEAVADAFDTLARHLFRR